MKMSGHRITLISLLLAIAGSVSASDATSGYLPFSGYYPIPSETPEPINIVTKKTYFVPSQPQTPLTFRGNNGQEPAFMRNTGSSLQIFQINTTVTDTVAEGLLNNSVYRFRQTEFYWANDTNKAAYTTINGKGSALVVSIVYVNLHYGPLSNAIHFRDGVAKVLFQIKIGSKPNPAFENFAAVAQTVQNPGPEVPILLYDTFAWFLNFPPNVKYYAYPGEVTDEVTGITSSCTTTLAFDFSPTQYISKEQFERAFLGLKRFDGTPLTNEQKRKPRGKRPVARSKYALKQYSNVIVYYASGDE